MELQFIKTDAKKYLKILEEIFASTLPLLNKTGLVYRIFVALLAFLIISSPYYQIAHFKKKYSEPLLQKIKKMDLESNLLEKINFPEEHAESLANYANDLVYSVCELAQTKIAKLMKLKNEQAAKFQLSELDHLCEICNQFMLITEKICEKRCYTLRGGLFSQVFSLV